MNDSKPIIYHTRDDPIIRFCAFYLLLYVGSLVLGGTGVFKIVFGLMIISTRVLIRFPYFQTYIRRFFGFNQPEPRFMSNQLHSWFSRITTILLSLLIICFYVSIGAFLIWIGFKELLEYGFLNQNLIYLFLLKLK